MKKNRTLWLVQLAMLVAISILLISVVRIQIIPAAPFLEYDMADMPIILAAMLFGVPSGWMVLVVVSFIQAFMMGGNGIIGFLMHVIASGVLLTIPALVYRKHHHWKGALIGLTLGTLGMVAVMIPLNLVFTVHFLGAPRQEVVDMLLPAIIPFNVIKAGLNSAITLVLMTALEPVMKKLAIKGG